MKVKSFVNEGVSLLAAGAVECGMVLGACGVGVELFYGRCPIEGPWRVRRRRVASLDPIATLHTLVISVSVPVQLYHGSSTDL